ncbi:MAG: phosphate ABC transporter, permease protein PstA, partial [Elusimicrobia bacterium]|nr:phosphate ABC transporter, permease protein PstA [Elusimicrobiota bacterium]
MKIRKDIARRKRTDKVFSLVGLIATLVGIVTLLALMIDLAWDGAARLNWNFLTAFPSRFPDKAGILSAWVGTG